MDRITEFLDAGLKYAKDHKLKFCRGEYGVRQDMAGWHAEAGKCDVLGAVLLAQQPQRQVLWAEEAVLDLLDVSLAWVDMFTRGFDGDDIAAYNLSPNTIALFREVYDLGQSYASKVFAK